jgi:hypothetical protein
MATILVIAFLARLPVAFVEFIHHEDEVWQYLEPAYHLLYGRWIVTWEYREGLRSWLIPLALTPPLALGKLLLRDTAFSLLPLRLVLVSLSLVIVWAGARIGWRISRLHGIAAALVLAISFEPVFLAARALSEPLATVCFMSGTVLLLFRQASTDRRSSLVGGFALGLAVACRFQFAPAVATLVVLCCWRDPPNFVRVATGGLIALGVDAVADAMMGQVPFLWMIRSFQYNLLHHVSDRYGIAPALYFVAEQTSYWSVAAPFILLFIALGSRREPILLTVALVNLVVHSAIPHKEFRFVFLTVVLLLIVGAVGSVDAINWLAKARPNWRKPALAGVSAIWLTASATGALAAVREHRIHYAGQIAMWRAVHGIPALCGFASLQDGDVPAAYVYIDRAIPIYMFNEADAVAAVQNRASSYNVVLANQARASMLRAKGYALTECFRGSADSSLFVPARLCLFKRAGGCNPAGAERYLENRVRARRGT